jgi:lysophospholipase L1-like esterase
MKKKILIILIVVIILAVGGFMIYNSSQDRGQDQDGRKDETGVERKFVALGSSISKANNLSARLVGDHPEYSYSTGSKINSVYLYLKSQGENLIAVNLAESGATTRDILNRQVSNALAYAPKYVTLDAGADIALAVPAAEFKQNLEEIINQLKNDDRIILIYTIPNFEKLRAEAGHASCRENKVGVNLEGLNEGRIQSFNRIIKEIAEKNGLVIVDMYNLLRPEHISEYDCLHFNISGQEKLAAEFIKELEK